MSIKTNELRIGNFIFDDENEPMQVARIETKKYTSWNTGDGVSVVLEKDGNYYECDIMNYIPLSEKWLINLGFNKDYQKGYIGIDVNSSDFVLTKPFVMGEWQKNYVFQFNTGVLSKFVEFEFVHQLQNFFFALTKKELSLNR